MELARHRLGYLSDKIRTAWLSGSLWSRGKRFVTISLLRPAVVLAGYYRLRAEDRSLDLAGGFADHRTCQIRSNPDHLTRLIRAYRKAKETSAPLRGIWAEFIATNYRPLISALETGNAVELARLLENHYREQFAVGTGGYDNFIRFRSFLGPQYMKYVWSCYRDVLGDSDVTFPLIGNPAGVKINGSVLSLETLRHAYFARTMSKLLKPGDVVVEIGGGLGGQCYQTLQLVDCKYSIYDIPEVAVISGYFLLHALPAKRVKLYGEQGDFDVAVLPHFSIQELPDLSVDMFYNSCSFSEMDAREATGYLQLIERAGRRHFMHDNHESRFVFGGDEPSVNRIGSEMVPQHFRCVYKRPRAHGLPEDRGIVQFEYLYERQ